MKFIYSLYNRLEKTENNLARETKESLNSHGQLFTEYSRILILGYLLIYCKKNLFFQRLNIFLYDLGTKVDERCL